MIKERKDEKAKADAEALLAALKDGVSMEEAGRQFDLKPAVTGFFKRNDSIPNIGYERDLSRAAFQLTDLNKLPEEVFKGRKGYYVIQFRQRNVPDMEAYDKEKAAIAERLLRQKSFKTFEAWLEQIKNRSEIVVESNFFNS